MYGVEGSMRGDVKKEDARGIERQSLQNNYQTSADKFSRNEDVEMGKREDQVGSHQK